MATFCSFHSRPWRALVHVCRDNRVICPTCQSRHLRKRGVCFCVRAVPCVYFALVILCSFPPGRKQRKAQSTLHKLGHCNCSGLGGITRCTRIVFIGSDKRKERHSTLIHRRDEGMRWDGMCSSLEGRKREDLQSDNLKWRVCSVVNKWRNRVILPYFLSLSLHSQPHYSIETMYVSVVCLISRTDDNLAASSK